MKKRVNITLEDKVIQRIDRYADEHYTSRSGAITMLIVEATKEPKQKKQWDTLGNLFRKTEDIVKVTMDYVVGNTAIQIVNTGKKVKIVDVEKQKKKRKFIKQWIIASAASLVLILSCFQIVRMENQEVLLNKQVYKLASQIDVLEKENLALKKQEADVTISYDDLFARAKSLGMKFPTNYQVQTYTVEKSTAVRLYGEKNHKLGK